MTSSSLFWDVMLCRLDCLTLEYGKNRLSQNVSNYHSMLHNISKEQGSHLHHGKSLKSQSDDDDDKQNRISVLLLIGSLD